MRLSKLPQNKEWERAKERFDSIEKELKKREQKKNEKSKDYER